MHVRDCVTEAGRDDTTRRECAAQGIKTRAIPWRCASAVAALSLALFNAPVHAQPGFPPNDPDS